MNPLAIVRRVLRHLFDATTPGAQVQIESSADEFHNDVEVAETYGLTTFPPDDVDEGIALQVGADNAHNVVIAWLDKTHRPRNLSKGELVLYSSHGQKIKFDQAGQVVITSASGSTITMNDAGEIVLVPSSGLAKITGNLQVSGNITSGNAISATNSVTAPQVTGTTNVTSAGKGFNAHTHGGIDPGVGTSGPPS
jgi:phage baseplate assembly protein V